MRLILFGTFFVILTNKRQLDAARELYGQSSGRIRPSNLKTHFNSAKDYTKQQHRFSPIRDVCPTFMQSRHFHPDQLARDTRDLGQPPSFAPSISYSYYYSYGGPGSNLALSSQEACRLRDNFCSFDYQCCTGKCRCVRWSVTGQVSCYKKCF